MILRLLFGSNLSVKTLTKGDRFGGGGLAYKICHLIARSQVCQFRFQMYRCMTLTLLNNRVYGAIKCIED
jgi:hypothetical protein